MLRCRLLYFHRSLHNIPLILWKKRPKLVSSLGSDSEPSGTEEEDDSDTLSESSGSENRLSQEELSSQEEEESVENEFFTPQKSKSPVPNQSPPSIAVASLQDLSNKMFQVSF